MRKSYVNTFKRGLKRVAVALITTIDFAIGVWGLIETALSRGYWAVLLFIQSIATIGFGILLLYAQGINRITYKKSKGGKK